MDFPRPQSGATLFLKCSRLVYKQTILVPLSSMDNDVNLEKLKQEEDEVRGILDKWPKWKQAIAYRYLYNLEIRISDVDRIIREGLRERLE